MAALPAFVALAEGRLADAERGIAAALEAHDRQLDLQGQWTELRLRGAELRLRLGRSPDEAAQWLQPVFERHAGDADIAAVWLAGPQLLQTLAGTRWDGALDDAQIAMLARWSADAAALRGTDTAPALPPTGRPAAAAAAEPARDTGLSERELEVLARIAAGDSNKLIARAFDLSPHTVKRHVANILDKLDLRSRGQASAWFHEHHA
jgi:LuxR family maltose regulon positive regulatory protein